MGVEYLIKALLDTHRGEKNNYQYKALSIYTFHL